MLMPEGDVRKISLALHPPAAASATAFDEAEAASRTTRGGQVRGVCPKATPPASGSMPAERSYDHSLLGNYGTRYTLFIGVVVALAAAAVLVPLTILVL
jgi:hypothetical protein